MAITAFPHHYTVQLDQGRLVAPSRAPITLGAPPQFGGRDDVWSPEDLLIGAALECLWTTFEAYARRDHLEVASWRGVGHGVLDKGPGGPVFTSITLEVELIVAADVIERARTLVETAARNCIISRALNVPVSVHAEIHAPMPVAITA